MRYKSFVRNAYVFLRIFIYSISDKHRVYKLITIRVFMYSPLSIFKVPNGNGNNFSF